MAGNTRVPPPAYALAAAATQVLLSRRTKPTRPFRLFGVAVAVGSFGVAVTASRLFHERGTTDQPFHPEEATVLVTDGPYAYTRNPMYVGFAGMLVGHAIARRSPLALLPIVGFLVVVDRLQIVAEEQALGTKFGAEYDAYRARVPAGSGPAAAGRHATA